MIRKISSSENEEFNNIAHASGSILNWNEWTYAYGKNIKRFGIYSKNNELIGGFLLYHIKKLGFSVYCDPPFISGVGPFLKNIPMNKSNYSTKLKKIFYEIADYINSFKFSIFSFSLNTTVVDTQPFIWKGLKISPRYKYLINLSESIDDILMNMSQKRRQIIVKTEKENLKIKITNNHYPIISLIKETFSQQKIKFKNTMVKKLITNKHIKEHSFSTIVSHNNKILAAIFCVYDKKTVHSIFSGYNKESNINGAGAFALWEAIKYSKNQGFNFFDFEGSMIERIERYLRGFGGELKPYYSVNKAPLPIEILFKFYKREIY